MKTFCRGFTLLELISTLAVSGIVLGLGVPSIAAMMNANRLSGQVNDLRGALALTRSEAITRNQHVVICKSVDGLSCTREGRWDNGWIVYVDENRNRSRDEAEPLLLVKNTLESHLRIDYRGFGSHHYVTYRPNGMTHTNGTFVVCDQHAEERSRALILTKTGRVRIDQPTAEKRARVCG